MKIVDTDLLYRHFSKHFILFFNLIKYTYGSNITKSFIIYVGKNGFKTFDEGTTAVIVLKHLFTYG